MERKRLLQEGLRKRAFPPLVSYPEHKLPRDVLSPLTGLFEKPVVVWVPESVCHGQKPSCVVAGCVCTPRVKEYLQRVVEDIDGKQDLLYIKYQCAGSARTCFSTISAEYLQSNVEALVHFSFLLGSKSGYSKALLEMVHDGIMSPNGLSSTIANIRRRRQTRYYKLYTLVADRVRRLRMSSPDYIAPTIPSVVDYCASQGVVDSKVLTTAWMETTAMYSPLCELLMQKMSVRKVLRVDHSAKFCKKLKVWEGSGQRTSISDAKLLLLVQNEIGQIVGRSLTRSENNEETAALLKAVKPILNGVGDGRIYLVSDNANGVRGMVTETFGGDVQVKQDPFHVMMRIKEKLTSKAKKKWISKELMGAMYTADWKLRPPEEMEAEFRRVTSLIAPPDLCTEAVWRGCVESNAAQIQKGDLFVENNDYAEAHTTTRIVATSQLEGFHSGLKKLVNRALSVQVGLRILDIFIVQHNLRLGANFGRNACFGDFDFMALAQAAMLSRSTLHESPQLAFISHILSGNLPAPHYRSGSSLDFGFSEWLRMFDCARAAPDRVEAVLARPRRHLSTIRELLLLNSSCINSRRLSRAQFMSLLRLEPQYSESSADFALEEYELLRQVRKEQAREECTWSTCPLVTTIMFNVAVDASTNTSFKLRQRSYSTIVAKLKIIADNNTTAVNVPTHAVNAITTESGSTDCNISASAKAAVKESQCARKLFTFDRSRPEVSGTNANEQAFQIQLFTTLRASKLFTSKKKLFVRVYHFAGCICDGIWPKSEHDLLLRWGAMKRADNRSSSLKIKLRVPSNTFAQSKMQQESRSNSTTDSAGTLASSGSAHPAQSGSNSNLGVCSAEPGTGNQPSQSRPTEPDAEIMVVPAAPNPASNDDRQNTTISPVSLQSNVSIGNEQGIDTAPQSSLILEQLPTMISEQDMEYFRTLAKSIKQVPGKWGYLHKCFLERYPESQLSANALRCRL